MSDALDRLLESWHSARLSEAEQMGVSIERYDEIMAEREAERVEKERAEKAKRKEQERYADFRRSGVRISERAAQSIVSSSFEETEAVKHMRSWSQSLDDQLNAKPICVFLGGVGCGKSFAAALAVWQLGGVWVSSRTLASRIHAVAEDRIDLNTWRVIVLDDLGLEKADANTIAAVQELVDARQMRDRPLIITSNLSKRQIVDRYGGRLADRLRESATVCEIKTDSMRGAG